MEQIDLVIIGAGWHGLAMAKTYTEVCPDSKVVVLDSAESIGGTWAKERLYPGLKTNNIVGSYEFSDFPMVPEHYGMQAGQHIPGSVVHEYLSRFADHFNLIALVRLKQRVESAELSDAGQWIITVSHLDKSGPIARQSKIVAHRLVVATGVTSEPFLPEFRGQEAFGRPTIHSKQLKSQSDVIETAKDIVVIGGNKSAWDACYSAASAGVHVNMIIRPSGGGPSWVLPVQFTPLNLSIAQMAATRFFTWFDPCIWTRSDPYAWIRRLLHRTWLGQLLVLSFWNAIASSVVRLNGYDSHPELKKLKPWTSPFRMGNSLSIHNYETNWFDLVRAGKIEIFVADVGSLGQGVVHLSNGTELKTDLLVCCTGWKTAPPVTFLPSELVLELGLPTAVNKEDVLASKVRHQILKANPCLRRRPSRALSAGTPQVPINTDFSRKLSRPYRLYRFVIPSNKKFLQLRNIAFIGAHLSLHAITVAQVQALWVTAFFQDRIDHLKLDRVDYSAIQYETILHSEYCRLRHPSEAGGFGERGPDLVFESLPYVDMILRDLGLRSKRKKNLWLEIFGRYMPSDFKGIVQEWMQQDSIVDKKI